MNINIEDYLSDNEIKTIIEEGFRDKIKSMFRTEEEVSRIITNLGYYNTFKIIEEEVPNFKNSIKEQTRKQCENISEFHVFREKDSFSSQSLGQKYLEEAVENNKKIINEKVIEIMNNLSKEDIASEICAILEEKIDNLFTKVEE